MLKKTQKTTISLFEVVKTCLVYNFLYIHYNFFAIYRCKTEQKSYKRFLDTKQALNINFLKNYQLFF